MSGSNAKRQERGVSSRQSLHLVGQAEQTVSWAEYPRLEPGVYHAFCKWAKWYFDPGFKRWTCLLRFEVLGEDLQTSMGTVPLWMNGGSGEKPKAGRRTVYFQAWITAKGERPARKDGLSPRVFVNRMAKIRIDDTKMGVLPYSVVREILEWSTGTPVNPSHSQGRPLTSPPE